MSPEDPSQNTEEAIRETDEEYTVGKTTLATIADPENAWIQSKYTAGMRP